MTSPFDPEFLEAMRKSEAQNASEPQRLPEILPVQASNNFVHVSEIDAETQAAILELRAEQEAHFQSRPTQTSGAGSESVSLQYSRHHDRSRVNLEVDMPAERVDQLFGSFLGNRALSPNPVTISHASPELPASHQPLALEAPSHRATPAPSVSSSAFKSVADVTENIFQYRINRWAAVTAGKAAVVSTIGCLAFGIGTAVEPGLPPSIDKSTAVSNSFKPVLLPFKLLGKVIS